MEEKRYILKTSSESLIKEDAEEEKSNLYTTSLTETLRRR
jgi:hypothetical protein